MNTAAAAAEVAVELERIYKRDSALSPKVLVEEARDQDSPVHGEFEWDNAKAAARFRMLQAAELIELTARPGGGHWSALEKPRQSART